MDKDTFALIVIIVLIILILLIHSSLYEKYESMEDAPLKVKYINKPLIFTYGKDPYNLVQTEMILYMELESLTGGRTLTHNPNSKPRDDAIIITMNTGVELVYPLSKDNYINQYGKCLLELSKILPNDVGKNPFPVEPVDIKQLIYTKEMYDKSPTVRYLVEEFKKPQPTYCGILGLRIIGKSDLVEYIDPNCKQDTLFYTAITFPSRFHESNDGSFNRLMTSTGSPTITPDTPIENLESSLYDPKFKFAREDFDKRHLHGDQYRRYPDHRCQ